MSIVDDVRTVLQDVLAPDLRAIQAVQQEMREDLRAIDARFARMEERFELFSSPVECRFDRIDTALSVYADVQRLKEQMATIRAEREARAS